MGASCFVVVTREERERKGRRKEKERKERRIGGVHLHLDLGLWIKLGYVRMRKAAGGREGEYVAATRTHTHARTRRVLACTQAHTCARQRHHITSGTATRTPSKHKSAATKHRHTDTKARKPHAITTPLPLALPLPLPCASMTQPAHPSVCLFACPPAPNIYPPPRTRANRPTLKRKRQEIQRERGKEKNKEEEPRACRSFRSYYVYVY
ncbi:uncharacterized protein K452DRAFT_137173 [Aplosporella prunicola CBS 121167]|uniref:Uncharacterized protein n=1 Tax=Aplosporella prunicola CBS 121167 TaxID=1176127 RepID=A0A6A6BNK9_9PEZI|nr:uncharacterized protein K452DRAFT_137173 [Aplosporella prunicola CBS 121167]KAF2145258.1 hypothetical protein K452DRAFT_137173 [Aplosporella prunicola CBS 121167]